MSDGDSAGPIATTIADDDHLVGDHVLDGE
jgi:hypothetical protein